MPKRKKAFREVKSLIASEGKTESDATRRGHLRLNRFVALIVAASCLLAVIERTKPGLPDSIFEVRKDWLSSEINLAETLVQLYPSRTNGRMYRAYQASMCFESDYVNPICNQFEHRSLQDAREQWQLALQNGNKEQEEAIRNFALVLYQLGESEEAAQVVNYWRMNYPHSKKPDPRDIADAALDGDKSGLVRAR